MNEQPQSDRIKKRRYEKPELTQVSLIAEEALISGCKQAGQTKPGQPGCSPGCMSLGS